MLACKYRFTRNLSSAYHTLRRKNGMQYLSRYNIFNSVGNVLLFMYIYKERQLKYRQILHFYFPNKSKWNIWYCIRDRPFNLKGGLWFFVTFRIFFSDNTRRVLTLDYMSKTESDYFFFPPPKSEYFFQQHWESEYFF
jgi:hypothetical protein